MFFLFHVSTVSLNLVPSPLLNVEPLTGLLLCDIQLRLCRKKGFLHPPFPSVILTETQMISRKVIPPTTILIPKLYLKYMQVLYYYYIKESQIRFSGIWSFQTL